MQYLKKMSSASMSAIPKGYKDMENGDTKDLFDVIGIAESVETGNSSMGEWVAFEGTFAATRISDGEKFRSKKLFLPDTATDMLSDALEGAAGGKVEFALRVGIRRVIKKNAQGEETGAGYEYTVNPILPMDEASDPLAALQSKLAALPAPTDATTAEEKPTSKKK
jgi:hypothetical protein